VLKITDAMLCNYQSPLPNNMTFGIFNRHVVTDVYDEFYDCLADARSLFCSFHTAS